MVIYLGWFFILICWKIVTLQGCEHKLDECRHQEHRSTIKDKALIGHVIANKTVATPQLCRIQCYIEPKCVSTNFDQNARHTPNCQLSSSEAESHPSSLVEKQGMLYQGMVNYCKNVTCPSQLMECHSGYGPQGYRCQFPDKCYKGPNESVLYFPRKSTTDYFKLKTSFVKSLTAFTLCFMVQIEIVNNKNDDMAVISLASQTKDNLLLFYIKGSSIVLCVSQYKRTFKYPLIDGKWHHICTTWESASGTWQVYVDGSFREGGKNLAVKKSIENGSLILGQEQDTYGGRFDIRQSFGHGSIGSVSLWNRVLLPYDGSFLYLTNSDCQPQEGNLLKWKEILSVGEFKGDTRLLQSRTLSTCT